MLTLCCCIFFGHTAAVLSLRSIQWVTLSRNRVQMRAHKRLYSLCERWPCITQWIYLPESSGMLGSSGSGQIISGRGRKVRTRVLLFLWQSDFSSTCCLLLVSLPPSASALYSMLCSACNGLCDKVCSSPVIDSVDAAQSLKDCTVIDGNLDINIRHGSECIYAEEHSAFNTTYTRDFTV